jgi:hypothetical protein
MRENLQTITYWINLTSSDGYLSSGIDITLFYLENTTLNEFGIFFKNMLLLGLDKNCFVILTKKCSVIKKCLQENHIFNMEASGTKLCATMTTSVDEIDPPTEYVVTSCDSQARYFCSTQIPGTALHF